MSKIFDERLALDKDTRENIIYDEHLIRYKLAGQFVKESTVLDIACGTGYGAKILDQSGAQEVIAMDIDKDTIEKAQKSFQTERIKYLVGDCLDTGLEDKKFDVAVSFETIEHLKDQDKYLKEVKRVLKNNGLAIISTPNKEVFGNKNPYHVNEFTKEEFENKLKEYFQYCYIAEQTNAMASLIQVSSESQVKFFQGKRGKSLYYIAFCSDEDIENKLEKYNYISVNYSALENLMNNPGLKLINKVYSVLIKIPGLKKIFNNFRN